MSTVASDMTQLAIDAQTLAGNLPPRCVNGLDYNIAHAMSSYEEANTAFQAGLIGQATAYVGDGNNYINQATNAIKNFDNSGAAN